MDISQVSTVVAIVVITYLTGIKLVDISRKRL